MLITIILGTLREITVDTGHRDDAVRALESAKRVDETITGLSNIPPNIRHIFPADRLPHGWPTFDSG
eukprot:369506-Prorocentrum_minimum.AAC.1